MSSTLTIVRATTENVVETLLSRPNQLLAAILSRGQEESINVHDLEKWWDVLPEMGYRANTSEGAAFIIGVRHGAHNGNSAPWFARWTPEQIAAGEKGWIYGRSRIGRPVLCPVLRFDSDPRLQFV